jgi:hypothetical protein
MHLRSLERFAFDSVLFPFSFVLMQNDDYRRDVDRLVEVCLERDVAMQTIKAAALRRWRGSSGDPRFSWYEPIRDPAALDRAVQFVLTSGPFFLNTSSDATLLRTILESAAGKPAPPGAEVLARDVARLEATPLFDGGDLERI